MRQERLKELETIAQHVELSLNALIDRQQRQVVELLQRQQHGEEVSLALSGAQKRLDELIERLERRRKELAQERQLAIADITRIGSALVLPYPEEGAVRELVPDTEVERIAMEMAMRYERERGWLAGCRRTSRRRTGGSTSFPVIPKAGRSASSRSKAAPPQVPSCSPQ
ncbi:hypothetical protein HRbin30_03144 [bacterium HR30]|nr:hypothetical protein HRbin30_03144 [bacterium HR30]